MPKPSFLSQDPTERDAYWADLARRGQAREAAMRPEADRLIDLYRTGTINLEDLAISLTELDEATELPN